MYLVNTIKDLEKPFGSITLMDGKPIGNHKVVSGSMATKVKKRSSLMTSKTGSRSTSSSGSLTGTRFKPPRKVHLSKLFGGESLSLLQSTLSIGTNGVVWEVKSSLEPLHAESTNGTTITSEMESMSITSTPVTKE